MAQERETLREQRQRIDAALERIEAHQSAPGVPQAALAEAASERGPELDVYGFIQLDGIYDINRVDPTRAPRCGRRRFPSSAPGDPACGTMARPILSVRQTRFGVRGSATAQGISGPSSSSTCSASARRGPDDVPPAPCMGRARRVRRARPELVHGPRRVP
jgi:hypothetical protein